MVKKIRHRSDVEEQCLRIEETGVARMLQLLQYSKLCLFILLQRIGQVPVREVVLGFLLNDVGNITVA